MNFRLATHLVLALTLPTGCDSTSAPPSKDDAQVGGGKRDGVDVCAEYDWYDDAECDPFCPEPDPDCVVGLGEACDDALSCGPGLLCSFGTDDACDPEAPGTCIEPDLACPEIFDPVCSCDGLTFSSPCDAHAAGANIASVGECGAPAQACTSLPNGPQCSNAAYCFFEDTIECSSGAEGVCLPRPVECPKTVQAVCGCDGLTYDNACLAAQGGTSVLLEGPCFE